MLDILEGSLSEHVLDNLKKDLSERAYKDVEKRLSPINVFKKIIDKEANIYSSGVKRKIIDGSEKDQQLLEWYEDQLAINDKMQTAQRYHQAFGYSCVHPVIDEEGYDAKPYIRVFKPTDFLFYSRSSVDSSCADTLIVFMGEINKVSGPSDPVKQSQEKTQLYYIFSSDEFLAVSSDEVVHEQMENPYSTLTHYTTNRSHSFLMPKITEDDHRLAILTPILLSDLNYAVKYQCFSILVGIDIKADDFIFAPNAIVSLESTPRGENPSLDAIKPQVDIASVMDFIKDQISMWLSTRGIKPGAIGNGSEKSISGLAKIVDEADTYESRKKAITAFKKLEEDFWNDLLFKIHPIWVQNGKVNNRHLIKPGTKISIEFQDPKPLQSKKEILEEMQLMKNIGILARKQALSYLYKDKSEQEIEELLKEVDDDRSNQADFENRQGFASGQAKGSGSGSDQAYSDKN